MTKATRLYPGKWLLGGKAVIILRTGQMVIEATILEKSFQLETPDLGTLTFKTAQVQRIIYKNSPTYQTDQLRTVKGSEFDGVVLNDPIRVEAEDLGGKTSIAKSKIISIIW